MNRAVFGIAGGAVTMLGAGYLMSSAKSSSSSSGSRYSGSHLSDHGLKNYQAIDAKRFEIVNAAVLMRHGARTPNYFVESKYSMPDWESGYGFVDALPEFCYDVDLKELPSMRLIEEDSVQDEYMEIVKKSCCWGQLTLIGQEQSLSLGKELRRIYMNKLITSEFHENEILCRTTKFPRTYYTLKGVLAGIYGSESFDKCHRPIIYTMPIAMDPLYPNPKICSAIDKFVPVGAEEIAKDSEIKKMKCLLMDILGVKVLRFTSPDTLRKVSKDNTNGCEKPKTKPKEEPKQEPKQDDKKDDKVTIYAIRDDLYSRLIHEFEVPRGFHVLSNEVDRLSSQEILSEYLGGTTEWEERIILTVSPTINFLKENMNTVIDELNKSNKKTTCIPDMNHALMKKKKSMKMQLLSCHDTTLIPLLMCLRLYQGEWPPFISNIIVELYRERQTGHFYTRVLYNGKTQRILLSEAECIINEYNKLGLVTYKDFCKYLEKYSVPNDKYTSVCDKAAKLFSSGKPITRDQLL